MTRRSAIAFLLISCLSVAASAQPHGTGTRSSEEPEFIRVASDGWHFETAETGQPFVPFGVNYYDPATFHAEPYPAYDVIGAFDAARTDRHFAQISDLGANIVRIFLSAVSFEPHLFSLDDASFETLDHLIALAEEHDLYLILDLTDTWEGVPAWQRWEYFADEQTLQGFEFLLRAFGERYADEPTIFAWNLQNEPAVRGSDSGIMNDLFGAWVRFKYRTEDRLQTAWDDYPRAGESWARIEAPSYETFSDQETLGSMRFFDFQLFREDVAYNWTRRLTDALRATDPNHMITVGLDQHSVPMKPDGTFYKPYTAFNPHKIASLVDFIAVHGYNWWGDDEDEYMEGLLRYAYAGKPVVVEEFDLTELDYSLEPVARSGSGWLQWAAYASPADWPSYLFDAEEEVTALGRAFERIAADLTAEVPARPPDAQTVDLDVRDVLISRAAQDAAYRTYVQAARTTSGPVGFAIHHSEPPRLLHLTTPSGDPGWRVGEDVQIEWEAVDWDILYDTTIDLKLSRDDGATWEPLAADLPNTGAYAWTVTGPTCDACRMAVVDHGDSTVVSEQAFSIASGVAIETPDDEMPTGVALRQNYPNPFHSTTTLQVDLPAPTALSVTIYDVLGREIAVLASGLVPAGTHRYTWNAYDVASGVYVCRLEAEAYSETRVLLLRE
ncbi:MAG: cellulase family glycosylhydrolase [Bacteroidetes bacterium]|jgi:hypothetical protein|nr:cellulase family glycosylhydrolase [Bacteroidota bacterium]